MLPSRTPNRRDIDDDDRRFVFLFEASVGDQSILSSCGHLKASTYSTASWLIHSDPDTAAQSSGSFIYLKSACCNSTPMMRQVIVLPRAVCSAVRAAIHAAYPDPSHTHVIPRPWIWNGNSLTRLHGWTRIGIYTSVAGDVTSDYHITPFLVAQILPSPASIIRYVILCAVYTADVDITQYAHETGFLTINRTACASRSRPEALLGENHERGVLFRSRGTMLLLI